MDEIREIAQLGLEGAGTVLLFVIAFKIYKMKCDSSSRCFHGRKEDNGLEIITHNGGAGDFGDSGVSRDARGDTERDNT